jgi:hypothetical protein
MGRLVVPAGRRAFSDKVVTGSWRKMLWIYGILLWAAQADIGNIEVMQ